MGAGEGEADGGYPLAHRQPCPVLSAAAGVMDDDLVEANPRHEERHGRIGPCGERAEHCRHEVAAHDCVVLNDKEPVSGGRNRF